MRRLILVVLLITLGGASFAAPAGVVPLDREHCNFQGTVQTGRFQGVEGLRLGNGTVTCPDVLFEDGTIEFDMLVSGHRSFTYILFRMQGNGEQEEIYFRPHKSTLPDAVQYAPVFKGRSNWQLFHGPGSTAAAELPPSQWIPVKLVVRGSKLAVFVGDTSEPQLVNLALTREPAPGFVALRAFLPQGTDQEAFACFANLRVSAGRFDYSFTESSAASPAPAGLVRSWLISAPFRAASLPFREIPSDIENGDWRTVKTRADGLVILGEHLAIPPGEGAPAVLARLTLESDRAQMIQLNFGYSDTVTVFLNGRPIFAGNQSYSYNFPRRQGLIGLDQGVVFLPLEAGRNSLLLAITDTFGGWGVMGQFPDSSGVRVLP